MIKVMTEERRVKRGAEKIEDRNELKKRVINGEEHVNRGRGEEERHGRRVNNKGDVQERISREW